MVPLERDPSEATQTFELNDSSRKQRIRSDSQAENPKMTTEIADKTLHKFFIVIYLSVCSYGVVLMQN